MKLNLGSGYGTLEGYENLDISNGINVYPLDYHPGSIDEIRASHVLEHFGHHDITDVIKHWVSLLKPGGVLKIAVPDFKWIAANYLAGNEINVQSYTMGGQSDEHDYHKCVFDESLLTQVLIDAGLTNIRRWESPINDCASLEVSLNLEGIKSEKINPSKVGAAMSVPRLGFMDNFFCAFSALMPLKIQLRKQTGAFWGQCLERAIDEWILEKKEYVLTIDYDSIFTKKNVADLLDLAAKYPDIGAFASVQVHRTKPFPLMTIKGENGNEAEVNRDIFNGDITEISTAHFGLTLIRVSALQKMPKPWFLGVPGVNGWDDSRIDDDIYFWRQFEKHGNKVALANRVPIGHAELMIRWPDVNFETIYQHPSEFYDSGEPQEVWK